MSVHNTGAGYSGGSANHEGCDLVTFENEGVFKAEGTVREVTRHPSDDDRLPVLLKGAEWLDLVVILSPAGRP
jgi:hypothetical protein